MKQHTVRLSFDIPETEHVLLKMSCAQLRMSIKEFLHESMLKSLEEIKKDQLHESLKLSFQQITEGKLKSRGSFAKYLEEDEI